MRLWCLRAHGLVSLRGLRSLALAFTLGFLLGVPSSAVDLPSPVLLHPDLVTYWGGGGEDGINDVSVDSVNGEQVITMVGVSCPGACTFLGDNVQPGQADAFVVRLGMDGRTIWSVPLGGPGVDGALALDVDADGRVAVVGWASPDFPTSEGALRSEGGGLDAFAALVSEGGEILYSAALGGWGEDVATAVAFDEGGVILLSGYTGSTDFPTTPAGFQVSHGGGTFDGFVARLLPDAALPSEEQLLYATFLGGSGDEAYCCRFMDRALFNSRLALLSSGVALVVGQTNSWNFPVTEGPVGPAGMGTNDLYVTVLDCNPGVNPGEQLVLSFLVGGSSYDDPDSLVVEDAHTAVIGLSTLSTDFPTTPGAFRTFHAGAGQEGDVVVIRLDLEVGLDPEDRLLYGTYLGGNGNDMVYSMAMVNAGTVVLAGMTFSSNFEDRGGPTTLKGMSDGFLAALVMDSALPVEEQFVHYEPFGGGGLDQLAGLSVFTSGDALRLATVGATNSSDLGVTAGAPSGSIHGSLDGYLGVFTIEPPIPDFRRGDANNDGARDMSDAIFTLGALFLGTTQPSCDKAADTNDDGAVDISDPVYLLGFLFLGGPAPSEPLGACGQDPTPDVLTCEAFSECP